MRWLLLVLTFSVPPLVFLGGMEIGHHAARDKCAAGVGVYFLYLLGSALVAFVAFGVLAAATASSFRKAKERPEDTL